MRCLIPRSVSVDLFPPIVTVGLSECRACELADLHRSVFQYKKQGQGDDALRKRLRELANERRRFGYRRLGILLAKASGL